MERWSIASLQEFVCSCRSRFLCEDRGKCRQWPVANLLTFVTVRKAVPHLLAFRKLEMWWQRTSCRALGMVKWPDLLTSCKGYFNYFGFYRFRDDKWNFILLRLSLLLVWKALYILVPFCTDQVISFSYIFLKWNPNTLWIRNPSALGEEITGLLKENC